METKTKRCTLATLKSFIKKNRENLLIRSISDFDPSVDGVRECKDHHIFFPVLPPENTELQSYDLGICGAWFVGCSRDRISPFNEKGYVGYHIYNCCGSFDLAIRSV